MNERSEQSNHSKFSKCEEALVGIKEALKSKDRARLSRCFASFCREARGASRAIESFRSQIKTDHEFAASVVAGLIGRQINVELYISNYQKFFDLLLNDIGENGINATAAKLKDEWIEVIKPIVDDCIRADAYPTLHRTEQKYGMIFRSELAYLPFLGRNKSGYRKKDREITIDMIPGILFHVERCVSDTIEKKKEYRKNSRDYSGPGYNEVDRCVGDYLNSLTAHASSESDTDSVASLAGNKPKKRRALRGGRKTKSKKAARTDKCLRPYRYADGSLDWTRLLIDGRGGGNKERVFISEEASPSVLLIAASIAYPEVITSLREWGLKLDELLFSGRAARRCMNLQEIPTAEDKGDPMVANCTPLLTKRKRNIVFDSLVEKKPCFVAAPMVVDMGNAYSEDVRLKYMDVMDSLSYDRCGSNAGGSNIRASFCSSDSAAKGPLVKVGQHFVQAVPCDGATEESLMNMHTELQNLFLDATREEMWSLLGKAPPSNYVGWREFYGKIAETVKTIRNGGAETTTDREILDQERTIPSDGVFQSECMHSPANNVEDARASKDDEGLRRSKRTRTATPKVRDMRKLPTQPKRGTDHSKTSGRGGDVSDSGSVGGRASKRRQRAIVTPSPPKKRAKTGHDASGAKLPVRRSKRANPSSCPLGPENKKRKTHRSVASQQSAGWDNLPTEDSVKASMATEEPAKGANPSKKDALRLWLCEDVVDRCLVLAEYDSLPFRCNLHLYKVGNDASYGRHRDVSDILNSRSHKNPRLLANGWRLPTSEELVVTTTCICSNDFVGHTSLEHWLRKERLSHIETFGCHIHHQGPFANAGDYEHSSERHLPEDKPSSKGKRAVAGTIFGGPEEEVEEVAEETTEGGSAPNLLEAADKIEMTAEAQRGVRAVVTSRMIALPTVDVEAYRTGIVGDGGGTGCFKERSVYNNYKETGVFHGRRETSTPGIVPITREVEPTVLFPVATLENKRAKASAITSKSSSLVAGSQLKFGWLDARAQSSFHQARVLVRDVMPGSEMEDNEARKGIELPQHYAQMRIRRSKAAITCRVVEHFLRRDTLLSVLLSDASAKNFGRQTYEPLLSPGGKPILPQETVDSSDVSYMKKNKRAKPIVDPANPQNGLALERGYKTKIHTVDCHHHFVSAFMDWRKNGDVTEETLQKFKKWYEDLRLIPIETAGSGGSASPPGAQPLSASGSGPLDCHHTTPANQANASSETQTLMMLCEQETPVSVFFNKANFLGSQMRRRVDREAMDDNAPGRSGKINDLIHAANIFANTQIDMAKRKPFNERDYCSLGFFEIDSYKVERAGSLDEIQADFSEIPGYVVRNRSYTSYKWDKNIQFSLSGAFSFETIMHMTRSLRKRECIVYKKLFLPEDNLKISATIPAVQDHAKVMLGDDRFQKMMIDIGQGKASAAGNGMGAGPNPEGKVPVEFVTTRTMIDHLLTLEDAEICHKLGAEPRKEQVSAAFRPLYGFTTEEWFHAMTAMQLSVAVRSNKDNCTRLADDKKRGPREYALPLLCPGSFDLPSTLRASDHPSPNMDYDLSNAFFRHNAVSWLNAGKFKLRSIGSEEDPPGWKDSYSETDLGSERNANMVANMIFMSAAFRFTGDVPRLTLFASFLKERGVEHAAGLPVPGTLQLYFDFLDEVTSPKRFSADMLSEQFGNLIDPVFKRMDGYKGFLSNLASDSKKGGMTQIKTALLKIGAIQDPNRDKRTELRDYLAREFKDCSGAELDDKMKFTSHKVLCDVESVFLDIFGEVTPSSLGFGPGSDFGLQVLTRGPGKKITALEERDEMNELEEQVLCEPAEGEEKISPEGGSGGTENVLGHTSEARNQDKVPNADDQNPQKARKEKKALLKYAERKNQLFEIQHQGMVVHLLGQKDDILLLLGWKKVRLGRKWVLRSIRTGRLYSRADTEHMFCKLYICTAMSHPSRNSGKRRQAHSGHCWPTPEESDWQKVIKEELQSMWSAYLELLEQSKVEGYFQKYFPKALRYADPHYLEGADHEGGDSPLTDERENLLASSSLEKANLQTSSILEDARNVSEV